MKRDQVFVSRLKVRIQTSVRLPTTFGRLATFEIGFEIYQSENDDGQAMFFSSRACEQAAQLARIILSALLALIVQACLGLFELIVRSSPCPVYIVVPD